MRLLSILTLAAVLLGSAPATIRAQAATGTIHGTVTLKEKGTPLHQVEIRLVQVKKSVLTDAAGVYSITGLPPGKYTVLAHMDRFPDILQTLEVSAGQDQELDIEMSVAQIKEEVTVTATGDEISAFDSIASVSTLNSLELSEKANPSIGEVLENEPGVSKRSFGPGTSRPVIRGFDGDRVLIVEDGARSGSLGSQSGDHGETVNVLTADKIEVVKGPATLLYGSSAIGGVVNVISEHNQWHNDSHDGFRGFFTGVGGTTNALGGFAAGGEYGVGKVLFWGNGGAQRTGDYSTPIGEIPNSASRVANVQLGGGYFGERAFASGSYTFEDSRYGVPFANVFEGSDLPIDLTLRNHAIRFSTGLRDLDSAIDSVKATFNYTNYEHKELEGDVVGTTFDNKQFTYRTDFDQRRVGRFSGQFGVWGLHRDYKTIGAEALTPPVLQNSIAAYGLEEVDLERVHLQFGGRVEHNAYNVLVDDPTRPDLAFTGFSGAIGARIGLWNGGAFVANLTHSNRAPALEELYNFGPHTGNLSFEIGNPNTRPDRGNGIELSLREKHDKLTAELNYYYYNFGTYVFLAQTNEFREGLRVANYLQAPTRYTGGEFQLAYQLHPMLSASVGVDYVNAELTDTGTPLPRIPPLGGHLGLAFSRNGLTVSPSFNFADRQDRIYPTETPTAGYGRLDLDASYTIAGEHVAHVISVNAFNLTNTLYRNHLSFIKDLAPEIGRGVRVSYTVRKF